MLKAWVRLILLFALTGCALPAALEGGPFDSSTAVATAIIAAEHDAIVPRRAPKAWARKSPVWFSTGPSRKPAITISTPGPISPSPWTKRSAGSVRRDFNNQWWAQVRTLHQLSPYVQLPRAVSRAVASRASASFSRWIRIHRVRFASSKRSESLSRSRSRW